MDTVNAVINSGDIVFWISVAALAVGAVLWGVLTFALRVR